MLKNTQRGKKLTESFEITHNLFIFATNKKLSKIVSLKGITL